jgi:mRNA interferase HigB
MVIISKSIINQFGEAHPDCKDAILNWYCTTKIANWSNYHELKTNFNSADSVGNNRYVFNIKGNHYRLIALILFETRTLFILFIGTHKEYDKLDANKIEFKKY